MRSCLAEECSALPVRFMGFRSRRSEQHSRALSARESKEPRELRVGIASERESRNGAHRTPRKRFSQGRMGERSRQRHVPEENRAAEHLANERTFLAWVRTNIALLSLGFLLP